ncbi:hypothetical protein V8C26DRAFT_185646 [Trichoderma gracile]
MGCRTPARTPTAAFLSMLQLLSPIKCKHTPLTPVKRPPVPSMWLGGIWGCWPPHMRPTGRFTRNRTWPAGNLACSLKFLPPTRRLMG